MVFVLAEDDDNAIVIPEIFKNVEFLVRIQSVRSTVASAAGIRYVF